MKIRYWIFFVLLFVLGCSSEAPPTETPTAAPTITPTLPDPEITIVSAPDVNVTAKDYLDAWANQEYLTMYNMLTTLSQDSIVYDDFMSQYQNVFVEGNLSAIETEIMQTLTKPRTAQVRYRVALQSAVVGEIVRDTTMDLSMENGKWRVVWDSSMILPELSGGNYFQMDRFVPSRGNIYFNNGSAIAANTEAIALGVLASSVEIDDSSSLITRLAQFTGKSSLYLDNLLFPDDVLWFVPITEVSADEFNEFADRFDPYSYAMSFRRYDTRLYFDGGSAAQSVGYVGVIQEEVVDDYIKLGYQVDDKVGLFGLENWGEEYLAGKRGGALYVVGPEGAVVTKLADSSPEPAKSIFTTLDKDLQAQAQEAIKDFVGAVVVLERDTGRILALVSSPTFNPNGADPNNYNSDYYWADYLTDTDIPFFNRATQGQYPPGSIFKVITTAAALESTDFSPDTVYYCGQTWTELEGVEKFDWTYEKGYPASGDLTLIEGLMRSCNPYFFHIGLTLFNRNLTTNVADMARGFGLGVPTGVGVLGEEAGRIDNPTTAIEAVDQAIGQSTILITPLQAAMYIAAVGNGGTVYRPQLIERIEATDGGVEMAFEPVVNGTLPISDETLDAIQTALRLVVTNPRGTAIRVFPGFSISIAGKTGTAETPTENSHSWFVGYSFEGRDDKPDVAIAVILEYQGEGSEWAAPVFKRVAEIYFHGRPLSLYPWESQFGVMAPLETEENE
jgi:penicillin-binding protein 2